MAITFRELSLIAELHYGKLPDAFKEKASEFFDALDLDGDGAVTLPELLTSNLEGKFGQEFIQHVFFNLDEEGKGCLGFRECLTLYYLCMYGSRTCCACEKNIPQGLGYTCLKCWKEGAPPNNQFNVCLDCFSTHNYQHEHGPLHLLHDFVLFDNLLHSKPSSPIQPVMPAPVKAIQQTMKQCIVCGDYHEPGGRGFTCDVHMSRMRDSTELVCEWCFSYMCSKCGNLFRDSTTRAEPGKWLQRFICPSCHQKNLTTDCYDASLQRLQGALGKSELLRRCKTCEIKQRNGTLFWIVNGTNTAAAFPANPQPRAPAAPNVRPRGGSFDPELKVPPSYGSAGGSSGGRGRGGSEGLSHGGSSRGGSSRGGRGGSVGRMNMQEAPPPPRGAPVNRINMQEASAAAVIRTVDRMVNVVGSAANLLNGFGGGGGGGNSDGGGDGGSGPCDVGGDGSEDSSIDSLSSSFDPEQQVPPSYNNGRGGSSLDPEQQVPPSYGGGDSGGRGWGGSEGSSHGGSSRGGRGGSIGRMNMQGAPHARGTPINRINMQEATAAAAIRTVGRMVNVAGRATNLLNALGGGGNSDGGSGSGDVGGDGSEDSSGLLDGMSSFISGSNNS